jgi:Ligated ion channel L-glutamate- and glycine-binding site
MQQLLQLSNVKLTLTLQLHRLIFLLCANASLASLLLLNYIECILDLLQEAPYVIKKEGVTNPTSHEDYDGFIPDLLSKISAHTGHKFTLKIVGDGKYGAKVDGSWNGMIGEVIQGVGILFPLISMNSITLSIYQFVDLFRVSSWPISLSSFNGYTFILSDSQQHT